MGFPCAGCGEDRAPAPEEACKQCRELDDELAPPGEEDLPPISIEKQLLRILHRELRMVASLQTRWDYENRKVVRQSNGKTTGRLVNRGLTEKMMADAKDIERMSSRLVDIARKYKEEVDQNRNNETDLQFAERVSVLLQSAKIPDEAKREFVRRILRSIGEEHLYQASH